MEVMANRVLDKKQNRELELKFEVPWLEYQDFLKWCASTGCMTGYRKTASPDIYYRQGQNVLRFRATNNQDRGATLTVKMRTSKRNTANRVEIDIPVRQDVEDEDTKAFLEATGWQPELHIFKVSHIVDLKDFIFWEGTHSPPVCLALYSVDQQDVNDPDRCIGSTRVFLEVEIEKPDIDEDAVEYLRKWEELFETVFHVKKALNKSLYELYTGKKTRMLK